jgi:hypothetical protein
VLRDLEGLSGEETVAMIGVPLARACIAREHVCASC